MKKELTAVLIMQVIAVAVCLSNLYIRESVIVLAILSITFIFKSMKVTSSLKEKMSFYEKAASTDALTGLLNRRGGQEYINNSIARSRRTGSTFSTIILDVDHFKQVNDKFGHSVGDFVLSEVAKVIIKKLREADFAIRWGGEEFLLCLPDTNLEGALLVAEKIREALENHNFEYCKVTASMGCSEIGDDTFEVLIARADMHLYMAKSRGRNAVFPRPDDL